MASPESAPEVEKSKYLKQCFVPSCKNSIISTPKKRYVYVPQDRGVRQKWYRIVGYPKEVKGTTLLCCEDHFNEGLPAIIRIHNKHTHSLDTADALASLPGSFETRQLFEGYFNEGMGISESRDHHKNRMISEANEAALANTSLNPKYRTVRHWYNKWRQLNSVMEKLEEKQSSNAEGFASLDQDCKNWIYSKMMGVSPRLKSGVVPHKFAPVDPNYSQYDDYVITQNENNDVIGQDKDDNDNRNKDAELISEKVNTDNSDANTQRNCQEEEKVATDDKEETKNLDEHTEENFNKDQDSPTIKQEPDIDEVLEQENTQDYNVTSEDIKPFLKVKNLHEIVTVKEEFMEQDDEEEEVIPSDFVRIKNEEEELNMCCTGCGEFFSGSAENTVCSGCLENDKLDPTDPYKLMTDQPSTFCQWTGLPNVETFTELYDYIRDSMSDVPDTTRFNQLFSVLVKLHLNIDGKCVDTYNFPSVYVNLVELLHQHLKFVAEIDPNDDEMPACLKRSFANRTDLVMLQVLSFPIVKKSLPHTSVRYLVAYTSTGRIFYISPCFRPTRTIEGIFRATPVARKLAMYPTYIFYKDGDYHIRSDRRKSLNTVISDKISQDYLNKLYGRLTLHFRVLDDVFPEYMLGEWQGKGKFLDKLLRVCCYLANVILAQQGAL